MSEPFVIEHDAYDRRAFRELLEVSESLREVRDGGQKLMPGFEALLFDLYAALYKFNVILKGAEALPPSAIFPRALLAAVLRAPAYGRLREKTVLDEERAGQGAVALAREVLRSIRRDALLDEGELLD